MTYCSINLEYNNIKNSGELELWISLSNLSNLTWLDLNLENNKVSGGFNHYVSEYLG